MLFAHRRVQCGFRERADPLRTTATPCSKNASCSLCGNGHKTGVGSRLVYQILQPPTAVPGKAAARRARNFSVAPTLGETVARRVRASVRQTARRRTSRRAQGAKHNSGLTFSAQQVSQIASVRLKVGCGYAYLVITAQPGDRSWISSFAERTLGRSPAGPGSVQRTLPHGDDVMKANGGLNRDPAMLGTSGYALRPNGQYFTPTWVTEALLSRVGFWGVIWEPAAGAGDMVKPLRVAGYRVFASELHGPDLGCADAVHLDFLEAHSLPGGVQSIVTNPPYDERSGGRKWQQEFIEQALRLTQPVAGMVVMLGRCEYDLGKTRAHLFGVPPHAGKIALRERPAWFDLRQAPRHNFAWFIWDWQHAGPVAITYVS